MSKVNKIISLSAFVWTGYITSVLIFTRTVRPPIKKPFSEEKPKIELDPPVIIYNRVQKCGSRTILQAVRPVLEFNSGFLKAYNY